MVLRTDLDQTRCNLTHIPGVARKGSSPKSGFGVGVEEWVMKQGNQDHFYKSGVNIRPKGKG